MTITGHKGTALGPLTTAWKMPDECSVNIVNCATCGEGFRGQQCVLREGEARAEDHTRCWPPATPGAGSPSWPFMGWGYYSPGVSCPVGYTAACTAEYGGRSEWANQFTLVPGETAIGCCPVGYTCDNRNGNTCVMEADRGHTVVATTGNCDDRGMVNIGTATFPDIITFTATDGDSSGDVVTKTRDIVLLAPMFQLNYQASDLPRATSTSTTTSTTSDQTGPTITSGPLASGASNPNSDSNNDSSSSSSGLSIGATAGIAVAAAIITLLLAALAWFIWSRRQRQRTSQAPAELPTETHQPYHNGTFSQTTATAVQEYEGSSWPPDHKFPAAYANYAGYYYPPPAPAGGGPLPSELDTGYRGGEMWAGGVPQEMDAGGLDRAELEGGRDMTGPTTTTGTGVVGSTPPTAGTGSGAGSGGSVGR